MSGNFNIIMNIMKTGSNTGLMWYPPYNLGAPTTFAFMKGIAINSSGVCAAVGYQGSGTSPAMASASSTGISSWTTPVKMNGSSVNAEMMAVAVNSAGRFVAVGIPSMSAYSDDGYSWSTPTAFGMPLDPLQYPTGIAVNSSGRFVVVGYSAVDTGYALSAYSTNGITWSTPAKMNGSSAVGGMQAIAVNSAGRFVAVGGNNNGSSGPLFAYSTNGISWTTPALMSGSITTGLMTGVAVNSAGRFVAIGVRGLSPRFSITAYSDDGLTWHVSDLPGTPQLPLVAVAASPTGGFMATGEGIWSYSADGITWTPPWCILLASPGVTPSNWLVTQAIAVNSSGRYIAVGLNASNYGGVTYTLLP